MPEDDVRTFEAIQRTVVEDIEEFAKNNPEIIEAMKVMNISMPDYLQAMESVRAAETFSCSSSSDLPLQIASY
jgi:hypothetical protein